MRRRSFRRSPIALFAVLVALIARPAHAADIDELFGHQYDLSGTYVISTGLAPDSTVYHGSVTIAKPKVVTSPRGTAINVYKMSWEFGKETVPGVAVQAGDRLYTAYGDSKNYGLIFWSKFDQPRDVLLALVERSLMESQKSSKETITYKGKNPPWWWYFDERTNTFGYYFHIDGTWGETYLQGATFPFAPKLHGTAVRELRPDGKMDEKAYSEIFKLTVEDHGRNLILHYKPYGKDPEYTGTGMRIDDDLVFGSWGGPSDGGVEYFEVKGRQLVGTYALMGGDLRGVEILDVPDEVAARNPKLFAN